MKKTIFLFIIAAYLFAGCSRPEIAHYATKETFPQDVFLNTTSEKRAMVIVAHDDDPCAMSGTLALLKENGWTIKQLNFRSGKEDRDNLMKEIAESYFGKVEFLNLDKSSIRSDLDTVRFAWMPMPKNRLAQVFDVEAIRHEITEKVKEFNPTVIFTLDSEMGGYGHPEHVIISLTVHQLFSEGKIQPEKIYQSVFSDHMENTIISKNPSNGNYPNPSYWAKKMYGLDNGMPAPDVEINIQSVAKEKMGYLRSFQKHERKNINKFIPHFEEYSAEEYFTVFDREFFRVVERTAG